ncbi:MAG: single-stranded DNA-binding protein [Clostridia bacterium]|nr:single-stranded DNA-binding protein [Clostridia bacterium]MDD4386373.1 single-stranded DNA-binding protein [Clostridia bacterium]
METFNLNNIVKIGGTISSNLEFSHEIYDERFYKFFVDVERLSNLKDSLPVIVSERIIDINNINMGDTVLVEGQFRSYNELNDVKSKLVLSIFAKEIKIANKEEVSKINDIILEGFICKKPIYRKTPLGREISDMLVAVNRSYKKSDYIPCILWGRNAKYSETLEVGTKVKLSGRVQARVYEKKQMDGELIKHIAYEISVAKFGLNEDKEKE